MEVLYQNIIQSSSRRQEAATLGLHAGADQGEGVAGELPTGTGNCATAQQHQNPGVCAVGAVLLQPAVLQGLRGDTRVTVNPFSRLTLKWYYGHMTLHRKIKEGRTHLVNSEVDAGVGYDAQHVGDIALIEGPKPLPPEDLPGAVRDPRVLARRSKR